MDSRLNKTVHDALLRAPDRCLTVTELAEVANMGQGLLGDVLRGLKAQGKVVYESDEDGRVHSQTVVTGSAEPVQETATWTRGELLDGWPQTKANIEKAIQGGTKGVSVSDLKILAHLAGVGIERIMEV